MKTKISQSINHFSMLDWHSKRTLLNIVWGILNIMVFAAITIGCIGKPWQIIWFVFTLLYSSVYWILAAMLFDAIIGNEYDNDHF